MASILDLNSDISDSEDDCDYVPPEGEVSDISDEDLDAETLNDETESSKKGRKGRRKPVAAGKAEGEDKISELKLTTEEQKKRNENIWKSFLDDVGTSSAKKNKLTVPATAQNLVTKDSTELKSRLVSACAPKKTTVTEVFDFAGESVTVTKEIDLDSKAVQKTHSESSPVDKSASQNQPITHKRRGGLDSLIGNIMNKKQKMTTLQKSLHDWNVFKEEEGIDKDLEKFNKGKGGFLEKQAFLQRSDLRQFELEKSVRKTKKFK